MTSSLTLDLIERDKRQVKPPEFKVKRTTLIQTNSDPQIWEAECFDKIVLYIRYNNDELVVRTKYNNQIICIGTPYLYRGKSIPTEQIEFLLEMYSKHTIKFE